jgi:hypothetical protein
MKINKRFDKIASFDQYSTTNETCNLNYSNKMEYEGVMFKVLIQRSDIKTLESIKTKMGI